MVNQRELLAKKGIKERERELPKAKSELGNIDLLRVMELYYRKGLSIREIAGIIKKGEPSIANVLKYICKVMLGKEDYKAWKEYREQILASAEKILLEDMLEGARREKAPLNHIVYAFDVVAKHRRLEAGEATENIGHRGMIGFMEKNIEIAEKELESIMRESGISPERDMVDETAKPGS